MSQEEHVKSNIKYLFFPKSVAVIGASRSPGKIGHEILRNIIEYGYEGKIYPVNPKADEILGLKCYKSILEIPEPVDLAVISIPAKYVPVALEECGKKGVKAAAIISSGFKEIGNVELENKIVEIARKYGIRFIGPNIFGVFSAPSKLNATFGPTKVLPGKIAFITQSGALGIALMGWTIFAGIGLSAVVSLGNKADVDEADLLEYFVDDEHTKVVLIYMEGLDNGRRFMEAAAKCSLKKPIIVIKAGRSERGARAVASHTGSLAGSDVFYDVAFKQCGVLRALNVEEAFDWARAFTALPEPKGDNVVIITNGGGIGVMATDACSDYGLNLMEFPEDLMNEFRKCMPPFGSPKNPVDLTGQAAYDEYAKALEVALSDDRIHSIILLFCQTAVVDPPKLSEVIADVVKKHGSRKPVVACYIGGEECQKGMKILEQNGIPSYPTPERAVLALAAVYRWVKWKKKMLKKLGTK
ncbi:MAG: acetyl CoA synthetase [Thermoprotei archaeon]|nr:MAG: acetyl CoA synthetase [Thermoprotei archaeon]